MKVMRGKGAGADDTEPNKPPLYARLLRLKYIRPGPWWCFLFFEGSIVAAGVLVLADWVSPWGLLVLPLGVAVAVKLNDAVTGGLPPAGAAKATSTQSADQKRPLQSKANSDGTSSAGSAQSATAGAVAGEEAASEEAERTESDSASDDSASESDLASADIASDDSVTTDTQPAVSETDAESASTGAASDGDKTVGVTASSADSSSADETPAGVTSTAGTPPNGLTSGSASDLDATHDQQSTTAAARTSVSDRSAAMRAKRNAIKPAGGRSRRIAGGKTTAPTRNGSTPVKDEG